MAKRFWSSLDYIEVRVGSRGNFLELYVRFHKGSIASSGQILGTGKSLNPKALIEVISRITRRDPAIPYSDSFTTSKALTQA